MQRKRKVLHVLPSSCTQEKHTFLGSTKDIRNRTEYFQSRGIAYDELFTRVKTDEELLSSLKCIDLHAYGAAVFEFSRYPRSLQYIREKHPSLLLYTRAINAEFYHRVHHVLSRGIVSLNRGIINVLKENIDSLRDACVRLSQDTLCARLSDQILSITSWEKDHYWGVLAGHHRVQVVPYFLTDQYLSYVPKKKKKKYQCLCFMSTAINPFLIDAAKNFSKIVDLLGGADMKWKFLMTGIESPKGVVLPPRISYTGFLPDPFDILSESRAIAILSDYGFGFKTKLLDAISCKCYILVTKRLYDRLPKEVTPFCLVVDMHSVSSFSEALEKSCEPYPEGDPNSLFRKQAFTQMDMLFSSIL